MTQGEGKQLRSAEIIKGIEAIDPEFILHIPSSTLTTILDHCERRPDTTTFPLTREEEGIGIAAGLELAGRRSLMIVQDNGLGNSLTALNTFPLAYHIPLLLLVSRRGGLNEYNSMIHTISERAEAIVEAAQLRYFSLDSRTPLDRWCGVLAKAHAFARTTHRPVIVFCDLLGE